jgi:hypothetical protein
MVVPDEEEAVQERTRQRVGLSNDARGRLASRAQRRRVQRQLDDEDPNQQDEDLCRLMVQQRLFSTIVNAQGMAM